MSIKCYHMYATDNMEEHTTRRTVIIFKMLLSENKKRTDPLRKYIFNKLHCLRIEWMKEGGFEKLIRERKKSGLNRPRKAEKTRTKPF